MRLRSLINVSCSTIVFDMTSFDIILGIDWLNGYRAIIDCVRHRVTFYMPKEDYFHFVGDRGCGYGSKCILQLGLCEKGGRHIIWAKLPNKA